MNTHNLIALKVMLYEAVGFFITEGEVWQRGKIVTDATQMMRSRFASFQDELTNADTFQAVVPLAQEIRRSSLLNRFYLPEKRVAFHERLVAIKVMAEEGLLENVEWWRARSLSHSK